MTRFGPEALRLLLYAALAALAYYFVILGPQRAREDAAMARADSAFAEAFSGAAEETVRAYETYHRDIARIDNQTQENSNDIRQAPGASQTISSELHAAGLRALCLHDSASPQCVELLHSDGRRGAADANALPAAPHGTH